MEQWFIGFFVSLVMAYIAYRQQSLSGGGMIGAIGVGTAILGGIGWWGFLVLAFFFVSSSAISKWEGTNQTNDIAAKGDRRDIGQVLANGGAAGVAALLYAWTLHPVWLVVFSASLAGATADTWASEIGKHSAKPPIDCFTFRPVEPGTSGGISWLGSCAGLLGAFLCALISYPLLLEKGPSFGITGLVLLITLTGWCGNWVDTWIGSRGQVQYQCLLCGQKTEQKTHCEQPTRQVQGLKWLNNDVVNVLCTVTAGGLAGVIYFL